MYSIVKISLKLLILEEKAVHEPEDTIVSVIMPSGKHCLPLVSQ
jgi:hypothetical protein